MTVLRKDGHIHARGDAFEIHVHGASHSNPDGTSRQKVILRLLPGDPVHLVREPDNRFDAAAVRIDSQHGTIGYVPADQSAGLAARLDAGARPNAIVQWVAGGTHDKPTRGIGIIVDFDAPPSSFTPYVAPSPYRRSWLARLFGG